MMELTKAQLERQDTVDSAIYEVLGVLAGRGGIDWDIGAVSKVREAIQDVLVNDWHLLDEMAFYPYLKEKNDEAQRAWWREPLTAPRVCSSCDLFHECSDIGEYPADCVEKNIDAHMEEL